MKQTRVSDTGRESIPYPNFATDPLPIRPEAPKKDQQAHLKSLQAYSEKLFTTYSRSKMRGQHFWGDFITCFRPHTILAFSRPCFSALRDLIIQRGIYIDPDRKRSPYESVIDILYCEKNLRSDHRAVQANDQGVGAPERGEVNADKPD